MTSQERDKLGILIESKIERLERQIVDLKELTKPVEPDCAIGRVSRMDAINNKSVNEAALTKKQNQLKGLNLALEDINKEDFQNCIVCGFEIPIQRVFIMPESRKCTNCASKSLG
ncbi:MAG: TraR/DksA family transcriptional regulator [Bacteroidales bacterium]|nr:TraR/DksA family transcriptional regulator [Bacteroidales bacterium]